MKTFKQYVDEAVGKFMTGEVGIKGKRVKVEVEVSGVDNKKRIYHAKVLAPKEHFGLELQIPAKVMHRGKWIKPETGKAFEESEYQGKKVKLNDPFRAPKGDRKKFYVYVKNEKGNVIRLGFGDPNMEIKRDDPKRRKAFRARHSCDDDIGPKWKARYWSCYQWRAGAKVDN